MDNTTIYLSDLCEPETARHELCTNGGCECPCHGPDRLVAATKWLKVTKHDKLSEVERLQAENAAMRPFVEALAEACDGETESIRLRVPNDTSFAEGFDPLYAWHLIERAREVIAAHPATSAPGRLPGPEEAG